MQNRFISQQLANRRRILRWLANFLVLCQNDVICVFYAAKTMKFILVAFISGGMVENSQKGALMLFLIIHHPVYWETSYRKTPNDYDYNWSTIAVLSLKLTHYRSD